MDPIIFTINLGNLTLAFRWYGLLVVIGILVGTWIAEREVTRRGGNPDWVWDVLLWVLPAAILGARIWYVLNDIFGGGRSFIDTPARFFRITEGGLHIYGAILFGGVVAYIYARKKKIDLWLLLDAVAPSLLIGQAVARPANYINQELYGPPTDLPWGIAIDEVHRIPPYNDLAAYPLETTRFHPTFAYEMIWNFLAAGLILWATRRFKDKFKPGAAFAAWLVLAGVGRVIIETFRPDQPRIPGTALSYSRLVAGLMALVGIIWLLVRFDILKISFLPSGPDKYRVAKSRKWKKK